MTEELSAHYALLRFDEADPPQVVDWLLVGPGVRGGAAERLASRLRGSSPGLRVAVVLSQPRWSEFPACDVRVPDSVQPADLLAAMRLAQVGIAVTGRVPRRGHDHRLSDRESELLPLLCAGLSNEQIARRMCISRRTVEFHLTRIFRKLGVDSRVEAVIHIQRHDLAT